ncbi:dol-P-Glc:Glc(2)Man(9)GlcNAc(2)-PP-Dol alpha-1,2-glucosyltransferase [Thrips palmi]|uniref:Dol-P-Glc:Glc(2)Man(9)GlcNAc(2)-PP-Dol alpha-1,2-glucosyltransferase n=1 Tax=Thrips palmi TaxID=161013 RepID=A0A6P9A4R9_THRPL|nr:dol-P-Glc:Glc(2)Man(9)GlcNAc(2)-PP-Dol alpha-1,2-glucosyltransferase [Thrips palmi]
MSSSVNSVRRSSKRRSSMASSRSLLRPARGFNLAKLAVTFKQECWLIPGLSMWLLATFLAVSSIYLGLTYATFEYMFKAQPGPYLDEVFHIPQAQRYCNGSFSEWDPKITTLPGLYFLSVGMLKPVSWFLSNPQFCSSVYALRCINMLLSTGLLYVVYSLLRQIHDFKDELEVAQGILTAVNICIFPVLYFFNFLYYTDVMSTFLVLFAYLLCLQERHVLSAVTGSLAVCVRQTNIVWVMFFGLLSLAETLKQNAYISKKKFTLPVVRSYKYLELLWFSSCRVALANSAACKTLAVSMLRNLTGYIFVGAAFIIFVVWNGSIVVGDKQAHQASIHLTQLLYFSAFFLFFMFPVAAPYVFTLHVTLRQRVVPVLIGMVIIFTIVHFNTVAHPYLLADNRHYTFYIWRRIIDRAWWSRYMVTPFYMLGCLLIGSILKRTDFVFQIGFIFCLIASIVPQSLLEFRYFIIPYVLLRLCVTKLEIWQLFSEMGLYGLVNVSTIMIYSLKTIKWPNMEEPQRFLW